MTTTVRAADLVVHLGQQRIRMRVTARGPITVDEIEAAAVSAAAAELLAEHGRGPLADLNHTGGAR